MTKWTKETIDLSLYYVTDFEMIPSGIDFIEHLEEALQSGVTIVQLREKTTETRDFVNRAAAAKKLCDKYDIPLIINDRIDVALAVDAAGVHLGQDDMPIATARALLPKGKIIGLSVGNENELNESLDADYFGIGAVYDTSTKKLKKPTLGPVGVRSLLLKLHNDEKQGYFNGHRTKTCIIGGLNMSNIERTIAISSTRTMDGTILQTDGVAIVSAIAAQKSPQKNCQIMLSQVLSTRKIFTNHWTKIDTESEVGLETHKVIDTFNKVKQISPLVHQITNNVAINDNANVTIALGGSPIMSGEPTEMQDLAKVAGSFVYNMGNIKDIDAAIIAAQENVAAGHPCLFDPVGVGASEFRRNLAKTMLNAAQWSVIKGNASEIAVLAGRNTTSKGVDASGPAQEDSELMVLQLARELGTVVCMTGAVDYVSDGTQIYRMRAGDPMMANITASGCSTGAAIATMCACAPNPLIGTITGLLVVNLAGERASKAGPGSFRASWIDEMFKLKADDLFDVLHDASREIIF